jgi:glycosyltransferase involved in cell wall biosynthesis
MKVLLLAPHPFYQERGTPIAVDLLLQSLSARGHTVDLLTWHIGDNRSYPGVTLHRIPRIPFIHRVRPGFSAAKLMCDAVMTLSALRLACRTRYDVVHAVEESAFMAVLIRALRGTPFVFDMDSSMPLQIVEKSPACRFLLPLLTRVEAAAIRRADAVAAVCDSLADLARAAGARRVVLLRDVSLLPAGIDPASVPPAFSLPGIVFLYVGNLERYQGIDLLLESFALARGARNDLTLAIAGGAEPDIAAGAAKAAALGVGGSVHFLGPRPVTEMAALFAGAHVLVSPRISGNNTPMKIYSYLDSGKPVLATDLPTHTQALNPDVALLAPPEPAAFSAALLRLANEPELRRALGARGRALAQSTYSRAAFREAAGRLYDGLAPYARADQTSSRQ